MTQTRERWLRAIRDQADAEIAASLRYDGKPLTELELEAVRVICARLSWRSVHWTMPDVDTIIALGVAFARAGWTPPSEARVIPSRSSDPATSKAAEPLSVKAGTQRARLLAAFGTPAAVDGLTDEEAADLAVGVPYRSEFAKRCSELRAAGLLEVVPDVTRRGVSGQRRLVSRITDAGRMTLERNGIE